MQYAVEYRDYVNLSGHWAGLEGRVGSGRGALCYRSARGELQLEEGGASAVAEVLKDPVLRPAEMPLVKMVHLTSAGAEGGEIRFVLNRNNILFLDARIGHNVVFRGTNPSDVMAIM